MEPAWKTLENFPLVIYPVRFSQYSDKLVFLLSHKSPIKNQNGNKSPEETNNYLR